MKVIVAQKGAREHFLAARALHRLWGRWPVLWWIDALKGLPQALSRRNPVSWNGYKKWLSLP